MLPAVVAPRVRPRGIGGTSPSPLPFFEAEHDAGLPKAVYAPVSMTDLKVSVTASTGIQARHRMPQLQFWSMIIGLSAIARHQAVTRATRWSIHLATVLILWPF